jgi:hypothetical protein
VSQITRTHAKPAYIRHNSAKTNNRALGPKPKETSYEKDHSTVIGLTMFASPLAAQSPEVSSFERERFATQRHAPPAQVGPTERFFAAPATTQRFALTPRALPARPGAARAGLEMPYGGAPAVPYSTPPQGWPDRR